MAVSPAAKAAPAEMNVNPIDVIIPVYEGFEEVRACLQSVLAAPQQTPAEYVVIHDAGPNTEIENYVRDLAESGCITLLENDRNLGFVRTVNRGMALHPDRDVVLLNSDTLVSGDWLARLRAHAIDDIGTVTPFSDNAEICSFPRICCVNDISYLPAEIDAALAEAMSGRSVDIPTAVGFCMYIRRDCLAQVGPFDAQTFGLGYGEENDFCLRARAMGWRHVLAADCYVAHVGGASFSTRKRALFENAMAVLDRLYPAYHAEVANWIAADPPYALRCKGLIEVLRRDPRQKVLAVTHDMGGGTEKHVRELAGVTDARSQTILLRPFRQSVVRVSFGIDKELPGLNFDWSDENQREALKRLLHYIGISRLHIHHVLRLEEVLPQLLADLSLPYDVTLHDYFFIDGNPTLTDESGLFQRDQRLRGRGCNSVRVIEEGAGWDSWRNDQQALLGGAERVFAPSRAALDLYEDIYALPNAILSGHTDLLGVTDLPVAPLNRIKERKQFRVLVLGALGIEKGGILLEEVAMLAERQKQGFEFVLLGYAFRPLSAVKILGAYRDEDLDRLILEQAPDLIWFPCRWPETYSYTLSAGLRVGCPLMVPDIGSFPERVTGRSLTWVVPHATDAAGYLEQIKLTRATLAEAPAEVQPWAPPQIGEFRYDEEYVGAAIAPADLEFSLADIGAHLAGSEERRVEGRRLSILRLLLWLKQRPALAWLARIIPLRWQRAVKRRLSPLPLHDLRS